MKDIELPPLPEPTALGMDFDKGWDGVRAYGYTEEDMASYARAAVEAERAQRLPDGWKLVPVEPTPKMLVALWEHRERMRGRGENAIAREGYSALLASTPAPAQRGPSQIKAEHKTVTPSGTVVTRLELTDKAKESLRANVTHIPGIAKHQEPPQQERKPMTNAPTEVEKLMDAAGLCRRCAEPTDTRGVKDVLAERQRQIKSEGYSPESDDAYWQNDLVKAAVCYAWPMYPMREGVGEDPHDQRKWAPDLWPWEARHWKPKDRRSNLVRAGALILAEIERLDRVERHHGIKE